ncbi:hypothetical protein AB6A40_010027 [Gnathostoma spinigerum]|uniref:Gustatory receptor n=1 Tax=Gnathostoma spinigerum TaxID=75299 RepID=A0ABD6ETN4_9BILA
MTFLVVGSCSLFAMYFPRSVLVMYSISEMYLMITAVRTMQLLKDLYENRNKLSKYLVIKQEGLALKKFPLCFLAYCRPSVNATVNNIRCFEIMVIQAPYVRIILEIISFSAFLENFNINNFTNCVDMVSSVAQTYGSEVILSIGKADVRCYCFDTLLRITNLANNLFTFQKMFFDIAWQLNFFTTESLLNRFSKAMFWNDFMLTLEMSILLIFVTLYVSPTTSALFDENIRYAYQITPSTISLFDVKTEDLSNRHSFLFSSFRATRNALKSSSIRSVRSTVPNNACDQSQVRDSRMSDEEIIEMNDFRESVRRFNCENKSDGEADKAFFAIFQQSNHRNEVTAEQELNEIGCRKDSVVNELLDHKNETTISSSRFSSSQGSLFNSRQVETTS